MTSANLVALQNLIQADPALTQQLQSATSIDSAAKLLAQAASHKGMVLDPGAITEYLKAAMDTPLTDAALDQVAGGRRPPRVPPPPPRLPM